MIAYRTGLHVAPTSTARTPPAAFADRATRLRGETAGCGSSRSRCSTTSIVIAVEEAARQNVPIQFHTGLGDPDLDLTLVDPAALRLLFSDRFRAAPIVLLHTGYPYVRSLAYLAAMFPNVYADMGEAILFAAGEATQITASCSASRRRASSCSAPTRRWCRSCTGSGRGSAGGRSARVLDEHIADGAIDERERARLGRADPAGDSRSRESRESRGK